MGRSLEGDSGHLSSCALSTSGELVQGFGVSGLGFSYCGGSDFRTKYFSSLSCLLFSSLSLFVFGLGSVCATQIAMELTVYLRLDSDS